LASSDKKQMIESKLTTLPLKSQCTLLGLNRSSFYYKKSTRTKKAQIKQRIQRIFEEIPIYGAAKVHQQLLEDNFTVSLNTVARYRQEMNLKAVLAVKQVITTTPIKEHKNTAISYVDLIYLKRTKSGARTLRILKFKAVWFIWPLLLTGIPKRFYPTKYPTPWTAHW